MKESSSQNRIGILFAFFLFMGVLGACAGSEPDPTVPPTSNPSPTDSPNLVVPVETEISESETSESETSETETSETEISETETSESDTSESDNSDEIQAAADPQQGREIFLNGGAEELYTADSACASCHSLDGTVRGVDSAGPSLLSVADRAGERVAGLSAEEYLRQSIMEPSTFVVPTYKNRMSSMGAKYLAVDEVDHLIAFLMTLSGETILPEDMGPTPEVAIDFGMNIDEGKPTRGKIMAAGLRCIGCHLDDELTGYGPSFSAADDLPPIWERGEIRMDDPSYSGQATTNQEYILESIFLPEIFIVPGEWQDVMPNTFHTVLSDEDLANIMAWLETIE